MHKLLAPLIALIEWWAIFLLAALTTLVCGVPFGRVVMITLRP